MPGLSSKTQRLSQAQLDAELSRCRQCFGNKWIHVAYSLNEESWSVYKFLCRCSHDSGLDLVETLPERHYNRPPDYTTAELEGHVYIHPRLNKIKGRVLQDALRQRRQELGLDQEGIEVDLPF